VECSPTDLVSHDLFRIAGTEAADVREGAEGTNVDSSSRYCTVRIDLANKVQMLDRSLVQKTSTAKDLPQQRGKDRCRSGWFSGS
jgi:hypothetical protein